MKVTDTVEAAGKKLTGFKKWILGVRNVEETESGLRRDAMIQSGLKTWSYRVGGIAIGAIGLAFVAKAGVFFAAAAVITGLWGCVKGVQYLVNKDIERKAAAQEEMLTQAAAAPTPEPAPAPKVKPVSKGFTAKAAAPPVNDEVVVVPRPTVLTQPDAGFLKKLGVGK